MKRILTQCLGVLPLAVALFVAGCASAPDRYYTLAAPTEAAAPLLTGGPVFIELAPVAVPERLARPQMLVQQPGGRSAEVALLEQHRWSSSFENELRDALASGIAARLGAIDVTKGGRQPTQPAWRIAVQVRQFDAIENTRVDAAFSWTVRRSDAERSTTCRWSASEPVGSGIDALAQGAQRVTAKAAEAIARHLATLQADAAAPCRTL
ncbi:PqiC family protein [Variovorax guangxiensis]|uniref:Membrane integrity-associated transporter subunit PqiC n=1 Tax=Variovorax guangxiensis TaxID=1775474 RepID=A0A502E1I1_9BURK|nr:PqiC family protein [Variovorax guangxiensis]RZI69472.1 MAG: membrane integrity-associated transporter subunit PqiC [Variovorax sp.]TPG26646.1 membrane integrity-associated transporter subunit PqiC [Variovorax ginsengisoli]TPG30371.1 membrane integrity-associated transporter subunit PqiC [Variovorax guangxiensis]